MISIPASDQPCEAANVASSVQRLGEGHQEGGLLARHTGMQELERQRRLARTRLAFEQIEAGHRQPAHEDTVQAVDTGGQTWRRDRFGHGEPR